MATQVYTNSGWQDYSGPMVTYGSEGKTYEPYDYGNGTYGYSGAPIFQVTDSNSTTSGDSGSGGSETSDVEIPTDTFSTSTSNSNSWSGLPSYASDYARGLLVGDLGQGTLDAGKTMASYLNNFQPFDWNTNQSQQSNYYNTAFQPAYSAVNTAMTDSNRALLDALQSAVKNNTASALGSLNSRGLATMLGSAAPQIWDSAMSDYTQQMAATQQWGAEQLGTLIGSAESLAGEMTKAMAENNTNQYNLASSALYNILNGIANILSQTRESTSSSYSYSENPLEPYQLMLSQWA